MNIEQFASIGHALLKILLPQGEFVDFVFLNHFGYLVVGVFGCYSVLNTSPLFFKQKYEIKAVKEVLFLFKFAKQSCNMCNQFIYFRY